MKGIVEHIVPDIAFEVSWEVANKVGGIYTVITSKIPYMRTNYDSYFLIGPLFDEIPNDVMVEKPPATLAQAFSQLATEGIRCVFGRWNVKGNPLVILIDARKLAPHLDPIKKVLWDEFGVDSLFAGYDYHEPLLWSWGVGKFIEYVNRVFEDKQILLHAHEWLAGFSVLYTKLHQLQVATVFTTHATMLGRSLASRGQLYSQPLEHINADARAKELGIIEKHTTEKACAHAANIFTTVSQTTAAEAKHFFGVDVVVLPNGITTELFPNFEETSYNHIRNKSVLQQFVMSHFFPYYTFDLDNTLFFYASGRYEFHNKGMDFTINALARLNDELKAQGSKRNVVMFFFIATGNNGAKNDVVENRNRLYDLMHDISDKSKDLLKQMVFDAFDNKNTSRVDHMVTDIKQAVSFMKRRGQPPLSTHYIDEQNDPIVQACKRVGLDNNEDDKVKIVLIPAYLDGSDGVLNMEYYEAVSACHLGIFPSNYEPWGYTPLESIALGVPAITSCRSGFGQYMHDNIQGINPGLFVIDSFDTDEHATQEITNILGTFVSLHHEDRVASKMNAHTLAHRADWRQLITNYLDAHQRALNKNIKE